MKQFVLLFAIIFISFSSVAFAQQDVDVLPARSDTKILILPFDMSVYKNDASDLWSRTSGMSYDEIRNYLRIELNRRIHLGMVDSCQSIDLLTSYTTEARNDLLGLYTTVGYEMRKAMPNTPEEGPEDVGPLQKLFKRKEKPYTDTVVKTSINNGEVQGRRYSTKDKYLHVIFYNEDFIPELAKRRRLDQVLFINQLEISGNYGDPYMSGNSKSSRTIKVHYSLYDYHGTLLHGGFASEDIPFNLDDVNEVVEDYFPSLVRQIILNINFD